MTRSRLARLFRPARRIICLGEFVDLDAFVARDCGAWDEVLRESFQVKIVRRLAWGDEIREYTDRGFRRRCGTRGLALVRRGHPVKVWPLWKS